MPTPTVRALAAAVRSYQRPLDPNDPDSLLETWDQVCDRVVDHQRWLWTRALDRVGQEFTADNEAELGELRALLAEHKAMLAGRTMWLGGTDIAKTRESSQFNCLSGDTPVLTREDGVVILAEATGKKTLLNSNGEWTEAEVRSFGEQELIPLEFGYNRHKITVWATADHRWRLESGEFVEAKMLRKGDKVPFVRPSNGVDADSEDYKKGVVHGLVYGDGTRQNKTGFSIRLFSDPEDLLPWFEEFGFSISYPPSLDGAPHVSIAGSRAWQDFKELPDPTSCGEAYLVGFFHGWFAADGYVSEAGQANICVGPNEEDWLCRWMPTVGFFFTSSQALAAETNYGKRNKASRRLNINRASLAPGDVLVKRKAKRVQPTEMAYTYYGPNREFAPKTETVYCAVVPDTHDFVLGNGMLTGNCSFVEVATIYDVVDALWLLLQGCGVGFKPVVGQLNGFRKPLRDVEVVRSTRTEKGDPNNWEHFDKATKTWTIRVGDSAEAWARAAGKLVAGKYPADRLVLDFSEIRPAGYRLRGYGWISSGDRQIHRAFTAIARILSRRADQLLSAIDILDICNHLGTILSSRRSAQIALLEAEDPEAEAFAAAKRDYWKNGNDHRRQSNNSIVYESRPAREVIEAQLRSMYEAGGSEPGIVNAETAKKRAPWFRGMNPCAEILLGNKSFCNLVEINLLAFRENRPELIRALHVMARANYRQTLVDLRDGVLQEAWHTSNDFLHLCGVGLTGIAACPSLGEYDYRYFANVAKSAAVQMAQELDQPLPKNVTTVKPSGTASKVMSTLEWGEVPEGIHRPMGKYIFNWITYSADDPIVRVLRDANYEVREKPNEPESVIVKFPVCYEGIPFERKRVRRKHLDPQTNSVVETEEEVEVNTESAVDQLNRYRVLLRHWCDHNASVTVYYDPDEIPAIAAWLHTHWDDYVAVSFLLRSDPTKTAEDLGHPYLPQEVVTESDWAAYTATLGDVDWSSVVYREPVPEDCATGACPIV